MDYYLRCNERIITSESVALQSNFSHHPLNNNGQQYHLQTLKAHIVQGGFENAGNRQLAPTENSSRVFIGRCCSGLSICAPYDSMGTSCPFSEEIVDVDDVFEHA